MADDLMAMTPDPAAALTIPPAAVVPPAAVEAQQPPAQNRESAPQIESSSGNYFDRFDKEADAGEPGLWERARLNEVESYYTGTIFGAGRLSTLAHIAQMPDEPGTSPEQKAWRQEQRDEYERVVADLAKYKFLAPWGTTAEGALALAGQLAGALQSPESYVGGGAFRGGSLAVRLGKAALTQGAVTAAVDPVVQGLNIDAGVQHEFDPMRTLMAGGTGAIVGGGLHVGGELLSSGFIKRLFSDLGKDDPQFKGGTGAIDEAVTTPQETPLPANDTGASQAAIMDTRESKSELTQMIDYLRDSGLTPSSIKSSDKSESKYFTVKVPDGERVKIRVSSHDLPTYYTGSDIDVPFDAVRGARQILDALGIDHPESLKSAKAAPLLSEISAANDDRITKGRAVQDRLAAEYPHLERHSPEWNAAFDELMSGGEPPKSVGDELALAARRGGGRVAMERARPDQGIPTDVATTGTDVVTVAQARDAVRTEAISSLQQQTQALADAIGFPLREGRNKRGTLGTFNKRTGVVRGNEIADFEVVSHESGHAIEAKAGKDLTDLTNRFASELGPLDYDQTKKRVNEGFAEFVRRYLGNPAHAQQVAPGFTAAFRSFMEQRHPEILASLDRAGVAYRAYLDAPSKDVIRAGIRTHEDFAEGWAKVKRQVREDGLAPTIREFMSRGYTALLDEKAPVSRAIREMARLVAAREGTPLALKAADNPEVLVRLAKRSQQAGLHDMMDGVRPYHGTVPEGPSLTGALEKATGGVNSGGWGRWDSVKRADFSDYLVARRVALLWDRFKRGDLPNPPAAFSKGDAVTAMAELERANPTFREASDMVHAWTRELLRKQYEGGLIGTDLYRRLLDEEFYVPLMRDMTDKPLAGGDTAGRGGAKDRTPETVKRLKGSSRDIIDPMESLMMQGFLVNRALQHNDVIRSFVSLAKRAGTEGGRYVEPITANEARKYTFDLGAALERKLVSKGVSADDARVMLGGITDFIGEDPIVGSFFKMEPTSKRGEPIVFYKEAGELKAARFMSGKEGHALYETLTAMPEQLTDAWSEMIALSSSVMRSGIITNPTFAVTNYLRDQFAAAILRNDYIPIVSGMSGIKQELTQGEMAKLYAYGGGVAPGSSIAPIERAIEADVNALAKKGYIVNRVTSFKGALEAISFTEAGTRNSVFAKVFEAKRAQGLSDYEAMIEAAMQATDLLDFSRHGSRTLAIRNYLPFINATLQGLDKARRTMIEPILRRVSGDMAMEADEAAFRNALASQLKFWGVGGVLGLGWAAINADSEAYRDASPYLKGTHVVIPVGNKVVLWPKPFELGIGFSAGEYAYQRFAQDDPRAADQFAAAVWHSLSPPNPLGDIPLLKTYIELETGKSTFTGRDIVPGAMQRLKPEMQYTDRTSSIAKSIGKLIGVSPIKVDYAIGSMFGTNGRDIMALSSGIDENSPAQSWEDRVFFRRLIKDPSRTSDVTTRYWDYMGQTTGKYRQDVATYDDLVKRFHDSEAQGFLNGLPDAERAFVTVNSASNEDGKPAFKADEKRLHPLLRSYDAVTLLNGVRRELNDNTFKSFETGENVKLDPVTRRDVIETVRELAQMEMRNAFVIMKEPGYANRALIDTQPVFDKIMALNPDVGNEIATRYATAKIYKTDAVARAYPEFQSSLIRDGSDADLGGLADDAKGDGYQFDGEAVKRPRKRRVYIPPQPQPALH